MRLHRRPPTPGRPDLHADHGATSAEYAILVAFVALAIFLTVGQLGLALDGLFVTVDGMLVP